MRRRALPWLGLLLLLGLPVSSSALDPVAEVNACVRRNLPTDSSVQDVRFVSRDKLGNQREILATLKWKRLAEDHTRSLARVFAPDDLRGSAVLLIQKGSTADLFMYLPELRKVRRVTSHTLSGNLFGSDFTYEDFQILHGMAREGATARLPDAELDGAPMWVLEHLPAEASGSAYERVVSFVNRETCLPYRAEMWEPGDRLRKRMTTDTADVFEEDGVRIPRRVVLDDLKRESSTRLELLEVDLRRKINRSELSPSALEH